MLPLFVSTLKDGQWKTNEEYKDNKFLAEHFELLEKELSLQREVNRKQQEMMEKQQTMIDKQSQKINQLDEEIKELDRKCIKEGENSDNLSGGIPAAKAHEVNNNLTIPSDNFRHRRYLLGNTGDTLVGFTAYLDHTAQNLGINQIVVFNKVLFNDGGWYNNSTGIFTCPEDAVYLFFFEVSSGSQRQIVARLVANNVNMVDAIADNENERTEEQYSNMAILRLKQGTHVAVENYRWGQQLAQGGSTHRFSTFSGILLSK